MLEKEVKMLFFADSINDSVDIIYRYLYRLDYRVVDPSGKQFHDIKTAVSGENDCYYNDGGVDLKFRLSSFIMSAFIKNSRSVVFDVVSPIGTDCGKCVVTPGRSGNALVKIQIAQNFILYSGLARNKPLVFKDKPVCIAIRVVDKSQTPDTFAREVRDVLGLSLGEYVSNMCYSRELIEHFQKNLRLWAKETEDSPIDLGFLDCLESRVVVDENGNSEVVLSPFDRYSFKNNIHPTVSVL